MFLLAGCPGCGREWNRFEALPEYDSLKATTFEALPEYDLLRATTAVRYPMNCPRCGCPGITYASYDASKPAAIEIRTRSYRDYVKALKLERQARLAHTEGLGAITL